MRYQIESVDQRAYEHSQIGFSMTKKELEVSLEEIEALTSKQIQTLLTERFQLLTFLQGEGLLFRFQDWKDELV